MRPTNIAADLSQLPQAEPPQAEDDFLRIERQLSEFPTLVYDGPFSDHVQTVSREGWAKARQQADEANNIARNFVSPENSVNLEAKNTGETGEAAVIGAWGVAVRSRQAVRITRGISMYRTAEVTSFGCSVLETSTHRHFRCLTP